MLKGHGRYVVGANRHSQSSFLPAPDSRRHLVQGYTSTSPQGSQGTAFGKNITGGVMEKLLGGRSDSAVILDICRDAYYYDPIMGGCADLMCNLPFSDFTLTGVQDSEMLETYMTSLEKIRIKSLLSTVALDYLVDGAFLGVLGYNPAEKIIDSMFPQNVRDAEIKFSPLFGQTPVVDITIDSDTLAFLRDNNPRVKKLVEQMPQ